MYFYRDYFILHPNQVICRVWSLRLFYRLSLWLAYMLYAKIVINFCFRITEQSLSYTVGGGGGGGGGWLPFIRDGVARRNLKKKPLRGTKILYCGRGLKFFHP